MEGVGSDPGVLPSPLLWLADPGLTHEGLRPPALVLHTALSGSAGRVAQNVTQLDPIVTLATCHLCHPELLTSPVTGEHCFPW